MYTELQCLTDVEISSPFIHFTQKPHTYAHTYNYNLLQQKIKQDSLALASMARDDPPASSMAAASSTVSSTAARRPQCCAVKWDRNLKPKLAIMRQCTSVTDRRTDRWTLASQHKREMYILHLALKTTQNGRHNNEKGNTTLVHLFIIGKTAQFDSTNPVQHDLVIINLKEICRSTSRYQPKYMLLVAIVIHNVNKA